MAFSVLLFGSHPDLDNDDCWTGVDFDTLEEARAFFNDPWNPKFQSGEGFKTAVDAAIDFRTYYEHSTAFFVLDGTDVHEVRPNPGFKPDIPYHAEREWRREQQREAGMLHGVEGWNDFEG